MEPFQAKLAAAAIGSTLTAITSLLRLTLFLIYNLSDKFNLVASDPV
jgi:hypothetical protein